jgi:phosphotransacetylase/acyl dehydratase
MAEYIENKTFDEINIGDEASLVKTLTKDDISLFAVMSGDINPMHVDEEFAKSDFFKKIVAPGMWGGSMISTVLGTKLPGPGAIYVSQTLNFRKPVLIGDRITAKVIVKEKNEANKRITFECICTNQNGDVVISGTAVVIAPTEKVRRERYVLPEVTLRKRGERYEKLIEMTKGLPPIRTAVVHPCDQNSLVGALDAAELGIIIPVLVGPEHKIRLAAQEAGVDISPYELVSTEHSHAAAERAVELAREGKVDALMKGSLHTDELMSPVVDKEKGLRTERWMSHVFAIDVPTYPKPLFLSDAAINIYPTLEVKHDIVQNAIDLALALGIEEPKVAILSATEAVTPKLTSTIEAAALCKMAERKQITGGILDGPLAFDNAVSLAAARTKGIESKVAGYADILIVPDLESGNMLAKQLVYLAEADTAGIVLGARVPIALTSRSDSRLSRMASAAIALLLAHQRRMGKK